MFPAIRRSLTIVAFVLCSIAVVAQGEDVPTKKPKPYKVLTSGKQVTIKSSRPIRHVMVWTASGHRIVEQRDFNAPIYVFNANVKEKVFFLMIQYDGLKPFTEKIGLP